MLRNFDNADQYFCLETKRTIVDNSSIEIVGWYKVINNDLSALLVSDSKLYFLWKDKLYEIKDNFRVEIEAGLSQTQMLLRIFNGNNEVVQFFYDNPVDDFKTSPFEYIDEDNEDWGMFIKNIINESNRRETFVKNISVRP